MPVTTIEIDPAQIAALAKALSPAQLKAALDVAAVDLAHVAEGAAKDVTPVVTGHARRSTMSDVRGASKTVDAHYPYFRWLDEGKDSRGRTMQTRPGGYRIRDAARSAAVAAAPAVLDKAAREILDRWNDDQ